MKTQPPATLHFPALLHGTPSSVTRKAKAEGRRCARHFEKTGAFPLPRELREVLPGELVITSNAADFLTTFDKPAWRLYPFIKIQYGATESVHGEEWPRRDDECEAFFRGTPWGALYHAVEPSAKWSAERMAARLGAVARFWEPLQVPRYLHHEIGVFHTLDELMRELYGPTLEAWCPEGYASMRELLAVAVERMARATREECIEAAVRMVPSLLPYQRKLKHPAVLGDPTWLREHLSALPSEQFERLSSAFSYGLGEQLNVWDDEVDAR